MNIPFSVDIIKYDDVDPIKHNIQSTSSIYTSYERTLCKTTVLQLHFIMTMFQSLQFCAVCYGFPEIKLVQHRKI